MAIVPGNSDSRAPDGDGLGGSDEPRRFPRDLPPLERDRAYQLTRCEGFRVEVDGRRLGVVAEVRFGKRIDVPDLIAVRLRRLGHRLVLVPVEEVEAIDPDLGVIRLEASQNDGGDVGLGERRTSREGRGAYRVQPAHAGHTRF